MSGLLRTTIISWSVLHLCWMMLISVMMAGRSMMPISLRAESLLEDTEVISGYVVKFGMAVSDDACPISFGDGFFHLY